MDEAYLHFIYCQDKEWIHGETNYKPRSRYERVWMDEGMITLFFLCDPSLLYIYNFFLDIAIPLFFSLFLGDAS
jgi:hypothetical protein